MDLRGVGRLVRANRDHADHRVMGVGRAPPANARRFTGSRYQLLVTNRTMTGQRMTTNSTGKMHTIIGTASLAGKA